MLHPLKDTLCTSKPEETHKLKDIKKRILCVGHFEAQLTRASNQETPQQPKKYLVKPVFSINKEYENMTLFQDNMF